MQQRQMLHLIQSLDVGLTAKSRLNITNDMRLQRDQFFLRIRLREQQRHIDVAIGPQFAGRRRAIKISGGNLRIATDNFFELRRIHRVNLPFAEAKFKQKLFKIILDINTAFV